jgi:hypothetical protein
MSKYTLIETKEIDQEEVLGYVCFIEVTYMVYLPHKTSAIVAGASQHECGEANHRRLGSHCLE